MLPSVGSPIQGAYINPSDVLLGPLADLDAFGQDQMSATSTPISPSNLSVPPPNTSRRNTRSNARYVSNLVYCHLIYSDLI